MYASMTNPGLVFNLPKLLFRYAQMVKLGDLLPLVASACGSVNGKVERRRRDAGTQPEQNDRRRAAGGSTPILRLKQMPLVTSARFAEWSGRRREGDRDDGQPVERSKPRVGHGGNGSLRSFAVLNTRSQPHINCGAF